MTEPSRGKWGYRPSGRALCPLAPGAPDHVGTLWRELTLALG